MRKVVLFIATSIDGFIAGKDGNTDWLFTDGDFGYQGFYNSIDTTLMGFNTYEFVRHFPEFPYPTKKNYVFSRQQRPADSNPVEFVFDDAVSFIKKLKAEEGKNIWLVGGGKMNSLLLNENLIDQMIISIHPVALGQGIKLFPDESMNLLQFRLVKHELFDRGLMQITYETIYD
jgi:dihydrofolate reductase